MRGTGTDQPVVARKPDNAGGAKGLNGSAEGMDQPARGGIYARSEVVRDLQAGGLGSVPEGQGKPRRRRGGRRVARSVREGLEEQPLQDLESNVLGQLLSTTGTGRGDPESQRRLAAVGDTHGRRSRGADGRE